MSETPDMQEIAEQIAESLTLSGALERACEEADAQRAADPEWNTPEWLCVATILRGFVHGVLTADPWHHNYRLPPDFEGVVNWMAFNIQRHWGREVVVRASLLEVERLFWQWAEEHPSFRVWNKTDKLVAISSRYSPTPEERDFIDLHALVRNAVVFLRDDTRKFKDFNARFDAEHAAESPTPEGTP